MRFKGTVTVALKEGIFDPQGAAVKGSLDALGYAQVRRVRMGKDIVIDLEAGSADEAKALLEDMARKLLANPVTELFRISVVEAGETK
jgi:phosphoribosylformylglycinamidine synthase PurS subunit